MLVFPRRRIIDLSPGAAQVTGRVRAAGPPVQAPLSRRACVYYQVLGRNHVWPWHDRPSYPTSEVGFWIDDGSGELWILVPPSPPNLECALAGGGVRRTIYAGESPELDRLLDPGGLPFAPDAYLNAQERIIADGDTLTIGGQVFEEITVEGQALNYRSPPMRLVLKAESLRSVERR